MERVRGIEPLSAPWQGAVLPLYDTRGEKELLDATEVQEKRQGTRRSLQYGFMPMTSACLSMSFRSAFVAFRKNKTTAIMTEMSSRLPTSGRKSGMKSMGMSPYTTPAPMTALAENGVFLWKRTAQAIFVFCQKVSGRYEVIRSFYTCFHRPLVLK